MTKGNKEIVSLIQMVKLQSALQSLKRIGGNWMTWKCSVFADKTRRYRERSRVSETDVFNELCPIDKSDE